MDCLIKKLPGFMQNEIIVNEYFSNGSERALV